jgi:hypothetical protein
MPKSEYKNPAPVPVPGCDYEANSTAENLPNTVPQAPASMSVESVDEGNIPYNSPGGEPHGNRGCGSGMAGEP